MRRLWQREREAIEERQLLEMQKKCQQFRMLNAMSMVNERTRAGVRESEKETGHQCGRFTLHDVILAA